MCVIDFTNSIEKVCEYGGSEKKKKIIYNGEVYLLKFPDPIRKKNMPLSYINNVFSEYIGCKIFDIAGPVTLYGIFSSWLLGIIYWIYRCFIS